MPQGNHGKRHAKIWQQLGRTLGNCGNYIEGQEYLNNALKIMQSIDDKISEANCLWDIGNNYLGSGNTNAAENAFDRGLKLGTQMKDVEYYIKDCMHICAKHCIGLGECEMRKYNYDEALNWYDYSRKYSRETGDKEYEGKTLYKASLVYKEIGDHKFFISSLEDAVKILEVLFGKEYPLASDIRRQLETSQIIEVKHSPKSISGLITEFTKSDSNKKNEILYKMGAQLNKISINLSPERPEITEKLCRISEPIYSLVDTQFEKLNDINKLISINLLAETYSSAGYKRLMKIAQTPDIDSLFIMTCAAGIFRYSGYRYSSGEEFNLHMFLHSIYKSNTNSTLVVPLENFLAHKGGFSYKFWQRFTENIYQGRQLYNDAVMLGLGTYRTVSILEKAIRVWPFEGMYYYGLAKALAFMNKNERALNSIKVAATLRPFEYKIISTLANLLKKHGDIENADYYFKMASKLENKTK